MRRQLREKMLDDINIPSNRGDASSLEQDRALCQAGDCLYVMAYEQDGAPGIGHALHLAEAFLLKHHVANGQNLVDDEDLRLEMGSNGKGEPYVHAGAVALDRRVEELIDL